MEDNKRLNEYFEILNIWNRKLRLIGNSLTKEKILYQSNMFLEFVKKHIKLEENELIDIGAGAGLLGLIWGVQENIPKIFFVERSYNRATFLKYASLALKVKSEIYNGDICNFAPTLQTSQVVITAQAFANILFLLRSIEKNLLIYNPKIVLLKQSNAMEELEKAQEFFNFDYIKEDCEYGLLFYISNISVKKIKH